MTKKPPPLDWYKCYPADWLKDTRDLTPEQRGIYRDIVDMIYLTGGAIPDNPKRIAYALCVHPWVWKRVRGVLLAQGFLFITGGKLHQKRAQKVLREQEEWRRRSGRLPEESPTSQPQLFENLNDSNGRLRGTSTESESDSESERKKERKGPYALRVETDDDKVQEPPKPRKQVPQHLRQALVEQIGAERAGSIIREYEDDGLADTAQAIVPAFKGYLKKCYGIHLGKLSPEEVLRQSMGLCGGDTALPKKLR